jgi:Nuclease-related domain
VHEPSPSGPSGPAEPLGAAGPLDAAGPEDGAGPGDGAGPEDGASALDAIGSLDAVGALRVAGLAAPGAAGDRPAAGQLPRPGTALASLMADPRMPIWIRRVVLAAAAGTVTGVLLDWRFGLTAAVVLAILDTVHRSRTTAVIPAAVRVTSAQRRTRRRLRRLSHGSYRTLHGRAVPGSNCIIDHLVIGPAGVFAVDSERWDRRLPVRATQGGQLFHGPYSQTGRLKHAQLEAGEAARLISADLGGTIRVRPAMVIYGPTVPWTVARISGVDVFSGRRLRRYLRAQARASRAQRLERPDVQRIADAAERALPRR